MNDQDGTDVDVDVDEPGIEATDIFGVDDETDETDIEVGPINAADGAGDAPATEPGLYYKSVDEFVRDYLRHVYRRRIDGRHRVWAARWWDYDEAVVRLEALWRAWERLRWDAATGMSVWLRDHADPHMAVLMDPDGPFYAADTTAEENHTKKGSPLPYEPPPPGLFPDVTAGQ